MYNRFDIDDLNSARQGISEPGVVGVNVCTFHFSFHDYLSHALGCCRSITDSPACVARSNNQPLGTFGFANYGAFTSSFQVGQKASLMSQHLAIQDTGRECPNLSIYATCPYLDMLVASGWFGGGGEGFTFICRWRHGRGNSLTSRRATDVHCPIGSRVYFWFERNALGFSFPACCRF